MIAYLVGRQVTTQEIKNGGTLHTCIRHPELLASALVLWEPMHFRVHQDRPSYMSMLLKEVGTNFLDEL